MFYAPEITSLRLSELAREGKLERMQTLVSFGCDVNAVDYDARTPLHAASGEGNVHILSYLLLQNADVNAVDHRGCTPLDEAVRTNHQLVAQRLREAGAQVDQSGSRAESPAPSHGRLSSTPDLDGEGRLSSQEHIGDWAMVVPSETDRATPARAPSPEAMAQAAQRRATSLPELTSGGME